MSGASSASSPFGDGARARRPRLRVFHPPAAGRRLADQLRLGAVPQPDPGQAVLLVRLHGAARGRRHLRDAAGRPRPRLPGRPLVGDAPEAPADGLLHHRHHRPRTTRPRPGHDRARAAAHVDPVREPRSGLRCTSSGVRRSASRFPPFPSPDRYPERAMARAAVKAKQAQAAAARPKTPARARRHHKSGGNPDPAALLLADAPQGEVRLLPARHPVRRHLRLPRRRLRHERAERPLHQHQHLPLLRHLGLERPEGDRRSTRTRRRAIARWPPPTRGRATAPRRSRRSSSTPPSPRRTARR